MVNTWPMITYDRQIQHHNCRPLENERGFQYCLLCRESLSEMRYEKYQGPECKFKRNQLAEWTNRGLEPLLLHLQWVTVTVFPFYINVSNAKNFC